jgi:mono/diheme cytochrome c family protein
MRVGFLMLVSLLALCSVSAASNPTVPEKARVRVNPLVDDRDAIAAGRKLFEQHCAECHGGAGRGGKRGPELAPAIVRELSTGELFWLISNGVIRKGMPSWSKLPEPERWQIVTYLGSLNQ